jgi:hypothetical protein
LRELIGGITGIAPMPIQQVRSAILHSALNQLSLQAYRGEIGEPVAPKEDSAGSGKLGVPSTNPAAS